MGYSAGVDQIFLDALSYDIHFNDCLSNYCDGQLVGIVHSIFNQVINIIDEKGSMLSIASKEIDNAPFTMRVDNKEEIGFKEFNLNAGGLVIKEKNGIAIDNKLRINILCATLWLMNRSVINTMSAENLAKNLQIYNNILCAVGSDGGCKYFYMKHLLRNNSYIPDIIERELSTAIIKFLNTLEKKQRDRTRDLIGMGIGLTPSGDDFITGFITVFASIDIPCVHAIFLDIVNELEKNKILTTAVSKQMISVAVNGESRENIYNFIQALLSNKPMQFNRATYQLFSIGSSSGTDISIGVVTAFLYIISKLTCLRCQQLQATECYL